MTVRRPSLLALGALALALLYALGSSVPSNHLWGLATVRFWPPASRWALLAVALAGAVPVVARGLQRVFDSLATGAARMPALAAIVVMGAVGTWVYAHSDPLRFAGDHALRVGMLGTALSGRQLFPQAFPLDLVLNVDLARALMRAGASDEQSLRAVGAALAALFAGGVLVFVHALGARGATAVLASVLLLSGGYVAHCAGGGDDVARRRGEKAVAGTPGGAYARWVRERKFLSFPLLGR